MSTFLEDNMVPPGGESSQVWSWLDSDSLSGSFMMNVDGASKGGLPGGNGGAYGPLANMSLSPVAKINGKLLTGNGLQAFQAKCYADTRLASTSSGDLSGAGLLTASHPSYLYDARVSAIAVDLPSVG